MRTSTTARVAVAVMFATLVTTPVFAQGPRGGGRGMPRYDTATEQTIRGTVAEVQPHQARRGGTGLHLALKSGEGTLDVHVGPTLWLSQQKYEFATGDVLEVTGSMVTIDGKQALLARVIVKGDATMTLRNPQGIPRWSRAGAGTN